MCGRVLADGKALTTSCGLWGQQADFDLQESVLCSEASSLPTEQGLTVLETTPHAAVRLLALRSRDWRRRDRLRGGVPQWSGTALGGRTEARKRARARPGAVGKRELERRALDITPSGRGVVSDSSLTLDMESLSGELAFTGMRYEGGGPWGDGGLRYAAPPAGVWRHWRADHDSKASPSCAPPNPSPRTSLSHPAHAALGGDYGAVEVDLEVSRA